MALPHAREDCTTHPFNREPGQYSRTRHGTSLSNYQKQSNETICDDCYCYVCDVVASECSQWPYHSNATTKCTHWRNDRTLKKAGRAPSKAQALTNTLSNNLINSDFPFSATLKEALLRFERNPRTAPRENNGTNFTFDISPLPPNKEDPSKCPRVQEFSSIDTHVPVQCKHCQYWSLMRKQVRGGNAGRGVTTRMSGTETIQDICHFCYLPCRPPPPHEPEMPGRILPRQVRPPQVSERANERK